MPGVRGPARQAGPTSRDLVVKLRKQLKPERQAFERAGHISEGVSRWCCGAIVKWRASMESIPATSSRICAIWPINFRRTLANYGPFFPVRRTDSQTEKQLRVSLERFCATFPDTFVVSDRGGYFETNGAGKGRLLTAGFHLMQGYFRDDEPLCSMILTDAERRELDALWAELNFVTMVPLRQFHDFIFFERAEPPRFMIDAEFDFARSEDMDLTSRSEDGPAR